MTEGTPPLPLAVRAGRGAGDALRRFLRVAPARERVRYWQVGPAVDMAAYHWSWLWMLAPLLSLGDAHPVDYAPLLALALTVGFVHRHVTLPTVYLDREVFQRHPLRFTVVPALLLLALAASPALIRHGLPAGLLEPVAGWPRHAVPGAVAIGAVFFVAGLWNVWHVHMQKYGILRLYQAKSQDAPVPGWVDRLLVLGWLPLIVVHLGTRYADVALEQFSLARAYLSPLVGALGAAQQVLLPVASGIAAASVVTFFSTEWTRHRWRNAPRLSMALGTVALSASFLVFNPIKVYIAFGFSHAVEYLVFVWAFERRRSARAPARPSQRSRLLAAPGRFLALFGLGLGALYLTTKSWEAYDLEIWSVAGLLVWGTQITVWMRLWAAYQSLLHFYYDGFLWKTRDPSYRDAI